LTQSGLVLERLGSIGEARAEWAALAESAQNPFATPEWCEAWLKHIGGDCEPHLFAARQQDGTLVAIVPLVVARGRYVRKARFLGFGPSNELGPIASADDREAAASALTEALAATRRNWDVFIGEQLPGNGWADRLGATLVGRKADPVVRGAWGSWDDYLASRSSNFRQELRRKQRRLGERGLAFREVEDASQLDGALDVLFELHRERWGEQASRWFAGREQFQRDFSRVAFERGWLRVSVLELEGRPVAAYHGLRFGDSGWSYQFGRDPAEDSSSVGLIMTAHAVRGSIEEGATAFRLGPGNQPYKLRFATGDDGLETVGRARGMRGRAALAAANRRAG
jgi:CelD/BcsL family acetyltransferase involved in cellulose biosynthesis